MASVLLSTIMGGSPASSSKMLKAVTGPDNITLKSSSTTQEVSSAASFFTLMATQEPTRDGALADLTGATTRQTIVDIVSGTAGILTHVVGASSAGSGDGEIIITIDGVETSYVFPSLTTAQRPILGGISSVIPDIATAANSTSELSRADAGWEDEINAPSMYTPMQSVERGLGIEFTDNIKVEQRLSAGAQVSAIRNRSAVTYVRN